MLVAGIDLSGPRNSSDTALAWFHGTGKRLEYRDSMLGVTDSEIGQAVEAAAREDDVVVGLDAPLSYGTHAGSRPSDVELRRRLIELGAPSGSVMAPTAPRMVYLTLRGISVGRLLAGLRAPHNVKVVEVHPGAALIFRGAPVDSVRGMKRSRSDRESILGLMNSAALHVPTDPARSDHLVAACAAAWAAWDWARGSAKWHWEADPPTHPFDFAC